MKTALAAGINAVPGWHAVIEYPHPEREWIIDVLAATDDGRRGVAFEVQLSSQTPERYAERSQRYFDSGLFPVWLVPRLIDYGWPAQPTVPAVVTGFGKSSDLPETPEDLLEREVAKNFRTGGGTLAQFLLTLLTSGPGWTLGSPQMQRDARAAAEARNQARYETEERTRLERLAKLEKAIKEFNARSRPPAQAFGDHLVQSGDGPYVWATATGCWKCPAPMLLWTAQTRRSGDPVPELEIRDKVGPKRFENHPEVHKGVDRWLAASGAGIGKARIERRMIKSRAEESSTFVCPGCREVIGQFFISRIVPEKWSLISAPDPASLPARRPKTGKQPPALMIVPTVRVEPPAVPVKESAPKIPWDQLHGAEGVAAARRQFRGTTS
ncbi:hypothetical protein [Arthrobacter sp. PAMC25284]|uniref:hypothetical protein n=1 Tax=Arthrobacter sp. PAMC25284 TaxID=2861279 RepID=UPI001C62B37E|nr:hypothetical protein [Arthrobacter sp. PAMC25284]QYF88471.1 hypothetical protein KY499_09220 [Arthrobacter sp. PAMC25284]